MIAAGTRFGPYEVLSLIGAGGMGEVYRARDSRLGREVALKVLPAAFARDAERLRRFELEARAAGILSHPNVLAIHDVGQHEGVPFVISELLEGETLRGRLDRGPLAPRKAIEIALQIAHGLAAAHAKGIVHRDLKPENLFVVTDGRIKILDFGLAKLLSPEEPGDTIAAAGGGSPGPPPSGVTEPGRILGTASYMCPEQVRGLPADHRSDLFAFGAILYEMIAGRRAFRGDSAVDTMSAILREEPPELADEVANLPPALERIIRHCVEKNPADRFQSARDLAFALESLSDSPDPGTKRPAATLALHAAAAAPPSFRRLTFRRGSVTGARFSPDGQTIIYGAAWDGSPSEIFTARPDSPESRALGLPAAAVLSISSAGEMAILLSRSLDWVNRRGTLARLPLAGGAPREVLEDVTFADWAPGGKEIAVVRRDGATRRLELPPGKVLHSTRGWISHPRVSPDGERVAFLDHPVPGDDGGSVASVDRNGGLTVLSSGWITAQGLAWSPAGDEVWFTATRAGQSRALHAVTLGGEERVVARVAGGLTLHDLARDGRALVSHGNWRGAIMARLPGETRERDLSWFDYSSVTDLSDDGRTLLFIESGEGGGASYATYVRRTDGSPAVCLGEGCMGLALSPDGRWVLATEVRASSRSALLLPTGAGEPRPLARGAIEDYAGGGQFFPDGKRILLFGYETGHGTRSYVQDLESGAPAPVSPGGVACRRTGRPLAPDGSSFAAVDAARRVVICPVAGGDPRPVPGLDPGVLPIRFSADGRALYVYQHDEVPARVRRVDLATGAGEPHLTLMPADPAGLLGISNVLLTADAESYAYSITCALDDLYLIEGL